MSHTLNITLGAKALAHSLLTLPDQFKDTSELMRAGHLMDLLVTRIDKDTTEDDLLQLIEVQVSEKQRDLLKKSVGFGVSKIPPGKHANSLMVALGFE